MDTWMDVFFPIPLTVLVARSKKLNNILMLMEILVLQVVELQPITAKALNGVENSFDLNVNAGKRLMNVNTNWNRTDNNNIGNEWSYDIRINDEIAPREMEISVGDTISFSARIEEDDTKPDVGSESSSHTVTQEDIMNGFSTSLNVVVTENGGRNRGKSANFVVTYNFAPK